jgi:hypothetical protein
MRALFQLVVEILYIEHLCEEIGRPLTLPSVIHEDNMPVITLLTSTRGQQKGSKHFLMLVNYCREMVNNGSISLHHVATEKNIADILTKSLFGHDLKYKTQRLLGKRASEEQLAPVASKRRAVAVEGTWSRGIILMPIPYMTHSKYI